MDTKLKKKLVIGQSLIWAATLITNAIILVVLDNWDGRFNFATVSMFSMIGIIACMGAAQGHLQSTLAQVSAANSGETSSAGE